MGQAILLHASPGLFSVPRGWRGSEWGWNGAGLLGSEGRGELQNQACSLPYSFGFPGPLLAQPGDGEVIPAGGLQAGERPTAVQDHITPAIQQAMRRVSGPPPSWGL